MNTDNPPATANPCMQRRSHREVVYLPAIRGARIHPAFTADFYCSKGGLDACVVRRFGCDDLALCYHAELPS